jgi:hypothetical protein
VASGESMTANTSVMRECLVGVGAINEVDARLERVAHDLLRDLLVGLAAEHHRAQAQGRHLQAEAAETAILHGSLLRESQRRRADPDDRNGRRGTYDASSSRSALASCRTGVLKPSLNHP